ncbi:MAG: FAD:protein FMN transferase [Nostocoides sp.]
MTWSVRAFVEHIMGMPISVHVRSADPHAVHVDGAVANVFAHLRKVDGVFSTWRADSDLIRIRRGELDQRDAHPWLAQVRALTQEAETVTGGIFTTDLLGPDGTRGWDPTGLVKGWGVAGAAEYLREVDQIAFSINAGGDIVCGLGRGMGAYDMPWRVGVQNPADPMRVVRVVEVVDGAVATSGSAARGAHIIDPRTGHPVDRRGSVTVTGLDLSWADVWATALYVKPTLRYPDGFAVDVYPTDESTVIM